MNTCQPLLHGKYRDAVTSTSTSTSTSESRTPTRERLLTAAVRLLAEKGSFDQVSLRAIASGAGVSPTAVYRHFDDHAELLEAVAAWCWEQFDAAVFGVEPGEAVLDEEPLQRFRRQGLAYLAFARENPGIYRVLMDRRFDDVSRIDDGLTVYAKLAAVIGEILSANDDHRDPQRVALLVHTWIHGIATVHMPSRSSAPDGGDLLDELARALGLDRTP